MTDTTRSMKIRPGHGVLVGAVLLGALAQSGCNFHSWFDQSVVGRWEITPTTAPILDRIAAIEGPDDEYVQYSEVSPDDLVPRPWEYRVGPGDFIRVSIADLRPGGAPGQFDLLIDTRGRVFMDEIGEVAVAGLTADGIREAVSQAALSLVTEPFVQVQLLTRRLATYTIVGAVGRPDNIEIPRADFYLMDALALAGWINEGADDIFVIRQIALSDSRQIRYEGDRPGTTPASGAPTGDDLLRDVDSLIGGREGTPRPGVFGTASMGESQDQPRDPAIGLVDDAANRRQPAQDTRGLGDDTAWMYLDGQWVRVRQGTTTAADPGASVGGALSGGLSTGQMVTQRIIRIPAQKLIKGDMRYNIVIEPGDIIRVPTRPQSLYFVAGFVNRPGGFSLAPKLTLMRAIDQAGGVNTLGVPERIELVRMLDNDRQATIQLDLRAINRGLEPDIYLKANDRINVGSAIWTYPAAVIRNGFRASYGFGFLLDRNFGNDVFGPPPRDSRF